MSYLSLARMPDRRLKRRHHTVPLFYLRRFATTVTSGDGQIIRVPLLGKVPHRMTIRDATVEKDFYLFRKDSGEVSDEMEAALGLMESESARGFQAVVDSHQWPPSGDVRWAISGWTALQALRGPRIRKQNDEITDAGFKLQVGVGGRPQVRRVLTQHLKREPSEDEIEAEWSRVTDFGAYQVRSAMGAAHIKIIAELLPGTTALFHDRGWTLIRFRRRSLLTSDNPVLLHSSSDHGEGIGLATAESVAVPLSRHVALLMGELGGPNNVVDGTTSIARRLNKLFAHNASAAVFHHPDDAPLAGVTLPEPETTTIEGPDLDHWVFPDGIPAGR